MASPTETGAEAVLRTLLSEDVSVVFSNPGTTEMHLVAALDSVPGLRSVLCMHETIATGAADGYARLARAPAATILHLGPGLANASANLHNARRARSPVINLVGDMATWHQASDAALCSDIAGLASWTAGIVRTTSLESVAKDTRECVLAAKTPASPFGSRVGASCHISVPSSGHIRASCPVIRSHHPRALISRTPPSLSHSHHPPRRQLD